MPFKFAVKIVWIKVYIWPLPVQWHWPSFKVKNASQTCLLFNLQFLGQYWSYHIQTWHDGRHICMALNLNMTLKTFVRPVLVCCIFCIRKFPHGKLKWLSTEKPVSMATITTTCNINLKTLAGGIGGGVCFNKIKINMVRGKQKINIKPAFFLQQEKTSGCISVECRCWCFFASEKWVYSVWHGIPHWWVHTAVVCIHLLLV